MPNWPPALICKSFLAIVLVVMGALAQAQPARLPTLGDGGDMSAGAERRLGDGIARELYRDPDYIDDPQLTEYVQDMWQALIAAARARGEISAELDDRFAFELFLGRDRTVNAFALPGGYLGVNLGLVGVVSTPDELASVLAHELSHISQRHIARLIGRQKVQTPLMMGAMVLGMLAASKNPQAGQALAIGGQALAVQTQLNFSRDMEREADRVGLGLMVPAGFAPQGFVSMFDKLQQANRINDNGSWPYLRSHPLTTQRIADMQARQPPDARAVPRDRGEFSLLNHVLLAARARVLSAPGVDVLRQWVAEPAGLGFSERPAAERAAVLYASALAASELRDSARARQWLARLQPLVAADAAASRQARLLGADIELRAGAPAAALAALPMPGASAGSALRPEVLLRAQALLALGRAGEASGALQSWVALHPQDATAWQALASNWQAQGQVLRAVRAEGEARAAQYDYAAAVDRFKAGQALAAQSGTPADYVEVSIIDTRLRAVQLLLREQTAER
ncbi:MAG: M48 family metalloprotease [Simplicispira suum]|uniref:Peptidase M48 n=2 Tax=Simplicispira suum TaxID=2109915 RepID=A0A2S0MZX0_9BURK|nr:peptidase M48 [Simplicispira suum]MBW7832503.1 M48 family metalloprotease [Simplicispira suum]